MVALGNAMTDLVANVDDRFLNRHGFERGRVVLGDRASALAVTADLPATRECAGGSAANTAVGVAALGGRAAFLGRCANDALGLGFRTSLEAAGVAHPTPFGPSEPPTGRVFVLVTPDHERSMMAFPGAGATLSEHHLDPADVTGGAILYLEGYLFYAASSARAAESSARHAAAHGRSVAVSLSDPICVDVNREALLQLVRTRANLLFANQDEITALYRTGDFQAAAAAAAADVDVAFLTRGEAGAVVAHGGRFDVLSAVPVPGGIRDLTGAGDLFAAGALYGLGRGLEPQRAARIGAACAAEVIGHYGARPEADLRKLVRDAGLL